MMMMNDDGHIDFLIIVSKIDNNLNVLQGNYYFLDTAGLKD